MWRGTKFNPQYHLKEWEKPEALGWRPMGREGDLCSFQPAPAIPNCVRVNGTVTSDEHLTFVVYLHTLTLLTGRDEKRCLRQLEIGQYLLSSSQGLELCSLNSFSASTKADLVLVSQ